MINNVAIQMDPIHRINVKTDTSYVLIKEAQERGYNLFYYTPDLLSYNEGTITARVCL